MRVLGSGTLVGKGAEVGFSNFGSLKSTETCDLSRKPNYCTSVQQFRLVEEH